MKNLQAEVFTGYRHEGIQFSYFCIDSHVCDNVHFLFDDVQAQISKHICIHTKIFS